MDPTLAFLEWQGSWFPQNAPDALSPLGQIKVSRFKVKYGSEDLWQPILGGCGILVTYSTPVIIIIMLTLFCLLSSIPKKCPFPYSQSGPLSYGKKPQVFSDFHLLNSLQHFVPSLFS